MDSRALPLRPHHGCCLFFFAGKGYSEGFVENMSAVLARLRGAPSTPVALTLGADAICAACPHCRLGSCESGQKAAAYDKAVLTLCGLAPEDTLAWSSFSALVRGRILIPGKLGDVCRDCEWFPLCAI